MGLQIRFFFEKAVRLPDGRHAQKMSTSWGGLGFVVRAGKSKMLTCSIPRENPSKKNVDILACHKGSPERSKRKVDLKG